MNEEGLTVVRYTNEDVLKKSGRGGAGDR